MLWDQVNQFIQLDLRIEQLKAVLILEKLAMLNQRYNVINDAFIKVTIFN